MSHTVPSSEALIARARSMIPALAERAAAAERARRQPADTIADMQDAGFFRMLQPKRWGGYEMSPRTFFDIQIALAEGDMSPAWIYGVVGLHPWLLALLDDRAAQEVWGEDSSTLICSSLAPGGAAIPVDGGYRLTGRWRFSSGCEHCAWCVLGAQLPPSPNGTGERILLFLPRRDYRIVDTWHVAGLRGTGSHDIAVDGVFVPAYRTQSMLDNFLCRGPGQAINDAPLYRIPFGQIFVRGVSTAVIGALQGMLIAVIDNSRRRITLGGLKTAEDADAQLVCADTAAAIDEATATLHRNFHALEGYAERGDPPPLALRLQYKYQSAAVVERCSLLAARLFKLTGGSGLYDEQPFGRLLADINAARQHNANQYEITARNWGTALLGLEPRRDLAI
ncbi:MAG: flavin-dependent monooxygenase [Rhizobiales bacterium]|nr:flavin-dependent monooxygenase [Hyphomicrobiales bacterium]